MNVILESRVGWGLGDMGKGKSEENRKDRVKIRVCIVHLIMLNY